MRFEDLLEQIRESDRSRLQYERRKAASHLTVMDDEEPEEEPIRLRSKRRGRSIDYDNEYEDYLPGHRKRHERRTPQPGWMGFDDQE